MDDLVPGEAAAARDRLRPVAASRPRAISRNWRDCPSGSPRLPRGRMTYLNRTARVRADVRRCCRRPVGRGRRQPLQTRPSHHVRWPTRPRAHRALRVGDDYHDAIGAPRRTGPVDSRRGRPGFEPRCVDDGPVQEKVYASGPASGGLARTLCHHAGSARGSSSGSGKQRDLDRRSGRRSIGTCRRVYRRLPGRPFAAPYVLDARRCLSY